MNDEQVTGGAAHAVDDSCGCGPTVSEKRTLWPMRTFTRRGALGIGALSVAAISAFGIGAGVSSASAADYPSWDDVQQAKSNEAAKGQEITRIQGLIDSLAQKVSETEAAAEAASNEFYTAQQAFFDATREADELQTQADDQAKIADDSARTAAQLAAQLYRNGGDDTALELFFSGSADNADQMLAQLGTMDKLLDYNRSVYDNAVAARNSAQLLTDQANVARDERDRLQQVAEEKMVAAKNAAAAAQAALDEQSANLMTLQAQLAALQDETAQTVAAYEEGVEVRRKEEEARKAAEAAAAKKKAEEAAAAAAAAAKAAAASSSSSSSSGTSSTGGVAASTGWVRPHGGYRSSGYGARMVQCTTGYCSSGFHYGVDLANGCNAPIYAAYSGTVDVAMWSGGYGNYIRIQHGSGIGTGYGHINTFAVSAGTWVYAGQVIAYAGNTGNSFGCHLHFEVYINGNYTNPIDFMAARGVSV